MGVSVHHRKGNEGRIHQGEQETDVKFTKKKRLGESSPRKEKNSVRNQHEKKRVREGSQFWKRGNSTPSRSYWVKTVLYLLTHMGFSACK